MTKKIILLALALSALLALAGCQKNSDPNATPEPTPTPTMSPELAALTKNTINATITLEDGDEINLELYPDLAPETVANFIELAEDGFYDGTIFHRVIEGFMIQGGGYDEDLNPQKAGTIDGEFASNGFKNDLSHTRGVISMARVSNDPDSASSQFFIMHENAPYLDGDYAAFGRVADDASMTVVDDIASVRTGSVSALGFDDVPASPIVIKSITIAGGAGSNSGSSSKKDKDSTPEPKSTDAADDKDSADDDDEIEFEGNPNIYSGEMTEEDFNDLMDRINENINSAGSGNSGSI